jgi:type I restriction enzyme, R subunit
MPTDTSERGLETLIVESLTHEAGYLPGRNEDYDRDHAVDLAHLLAFLKGTQPQGVESLGIETDGPSRLQFLHRLQGEIAKRGVIEVLRKGIKHGAASLDLFFGTPTPGNPRAVELFRANRFSVTRQLHYSKDETQLALDLGVFINGLPVATFELKNKLTKQTVADAVTQYMRDRDPKELLFQYGQLPRRDQVFAGDCVAGPGCGNRSRSDGRRRRKARAGNRPAEQHHQDLQ